MDVEKLITLVHGHECLWDQNNTNYQLRDHQRNSWQKISDEMVIPVDELKKKWRALRDSFGRELKKATKKNLGQLTDREPSSNWRYFKILLFLRSTMFRRDLKGDTSETNDDWDMSSEGESGTTISADFDYWSAPASSNPRQVLLQNNVQISAKTFTSPSRKKVKRETPDEIDPNLSRNEEEKLKYVEESADNSDAQFLLSLLPYLKDIPKHRKLMVRTKLLQVFMDEQNASSSVVKFHYASDSSECTVYGLPQNVSTQGQSQESVLPH